MKVNEAKTDLCLFHARDTTPISVNINGVSILTKKTINILGVIFDQKLQWSEHIAHCILKSNVALSAIRLIRRFFTTKELLQLVTSNFYSILYYNSEIWHLHTLKTNLKQNILSSSARAIKVCLKFDSNDISFLNLHEMYNRAPPEKFLLYRHALALYKITNDNNHSLEWAALNFNQILTSRQSKFFSLRGNNKRVGLNAIANRFFILNNRIPLNWFNLSIDSFKVHCKSEFLS